MLLVALAHLAKIEIPGQRFKYSSNGRLPRLRSDTETDALLGKCHITSDQERSCSRVCGAHCRSVAGGLKI